jgi:hypothetical protein
MKKRPLNAILQAAITKAGGGEWDDAILAGVGNYMRTKGDTDQSRAIDGALANRGYDHGKRGATLQGLLGRNKDYNEQIYKQNVEQNAGSLDQMGKTYQQQQQNYNNEQRAEDLRYRTAGDLTKHGYDVNQRIYGDSMGLVNNGRAQQLELQGGMDKLDRADFDAANNTDFGVVNKYAGNVNAASAGAAKTPVASAPNLGGGGLFGNRMAAGNLRNFRTLGDNTKVNAMQHGYNMEGQADSYGAGRNTLQRMLLQQQSQRGGAATNYNLGRVKPTYDERLKGARLATMGAMI